MKVVTWSYTESWHLYLHSGSGISQTSLVLRSLVASHHPLLGIAWIKHALWVINLAVTHEVAVFYSSMEMCRKRWANSGNSPVRIWAQINTTPIELQGWSLFVEPCKRTTQEVRINVICIIRYKMTGNHHSDGKDDCTSGRDRLWIDASMALNRHIRGATRASDVIFFSLEATNHIAVF